MDKLDQALAGILNNEKSLAESRISFNQLQSQFNQGIDKSTDWLYRNDQRSQRITSEFDLIRKEIR